MADLNAIPMVMVDRLEILTDGGSALYGSDAVAGAVNVIMRTDFEGFELFGDIQGVEKAGDLHDTTLSAILGWADDGGKSHFVLAAERYERDPMPVEHARYFDENSQFSDIVGGPRAVLKLCSTIRSLVPTSMPPISVLPSQLATSPKAD